MRVSCVCSGLPVQLDRLLSVLLPDQHHRRTLRRHLWVRPLPHQVDSDCSGTTKHKKALKSFVRWKNANLHLFLSFSFLTTSPATSTVSTGSGGSSCFLVSSSFFLHFHTSENCDLMGFDSPPSAGLLLFFRGFVNYLKVRNMTENMATSHRTRLFFLY